MEEPVYTGPPFTNRRISMDVPRDEYERIAAEITSDESPVGIDAKKTHIIILHKLMAIEERLAKLEEKVTSGVRSGGP